METTINGRRYWKEGEQWYREILKGEELPMVTQILVGESWDWSPDYYHLDRDTRDGREEWHPRRVECDDPTAALVVKEGDTVSTPIGTAKVVKPELAGESPKSVFVNDSASWRVRLHVCITSPSSSQKTAHTLDVGGCDFYAAVVNAMTVLFPEKRFTIWYKSRPRGTGFEASVEFKGDESVTCLIWGTVDRIAECVDVDSPVAVATEDSKPDGDSHLVKAKLPNGATEESGGKPRQEATTSSSSSASILSLRDQFAMAALSALVQRSGRNLTVDDRLAMCREAYAIAEDMMKARGE